MPLVPTRELVVKKLRDCFPQPATAAEALAILDMYGTEVWQRERERVQLALLKLSAGDLEKLRLYTRGARTDYRETLIPAEFYESSQALSKLPPEEKRAIAQRDRDNYEAWLASDGA